MAGTGPYRLVRHPQYIAFIVIMMGFLLQWPTIPTLVLFPILLTVYVRLARREEREVEAELGDAWRAYAAVTLGWIPLPWKSKRHRAIAGESQVVPKS